jgi:hypothetical protein
MSVVGALEIDEVRASDQGSYRCNASSLYQHRLSTAAALSIDINLGELVIWSVQVRLTGAVSDLFLDLHVELLCYSECVWHIIISWTIHWQTDLAQQFNRTETLIATHLVKKFIAFYWSWNVVILFMRDWQWVMFRAAWVQFHAPFPDICFLLPCIFSCVCMWSSSFRSSNQSFECISFLLHAYYKCAVI